MAITYNVKDNQQGGIVINIPNQTGRSFGKIKVTDQNDAEIYNYDFSAIPSTQSTLIIKISGSDITNISTLQKINVLIDYEGADYGKTFDLSNPKNINYIENLISGNWLHFYFPISWS